MIYYFDTLSSTNDYMYEFLSSFSDGDVVLTFHQTNGKGRGDHIWNSSETSFAYSILKTVPQPLPQASLMSGLAVTQTIEKTTLKWPNDIMFNNKKLGGILCKSIISPDNTKIIIGIGININENEDFFSGHNLTAATSLSIENNTFYDDIFFYDLADKLTKNINRIFCDDISWIENYKDVCVTLGKYVKLRFDEEVVCGIAKDILPDGRMILECDNGKIRKVYANNWDGEK